MPTLPASAAAIDALASRAGRVSPDRRRFPREDSVSLVAIIADGTHDGPPGGEVVLVDSSAGGVGIRSMFRLPLGARYRLRVDDRPLDQSRLVRIVSCRRADEEGSHWFVGAAYC